MTTEAIKQAAKALQEIDREIAGNDLTWDRISPDSQAVYEIEAARCVQIHDFHRYTLRSIKSWHEDDGDVIWFRLPIEEAPWCGTPFDSNWPGYHTHWCPLPNVSAALPPSTGDNH